ncbi:hypothetical protein TIFTF001_032780 [Ficus carica]|uniref:Uncharacterized protein n=1 Tax=Ficus carica TaxID=3494 RepID=A0AA88DXN9_FICCA|nr:hypothetical protein TIFTF001_032780 [Ficus carica]
MAGYNSPPSWKIRRQPDFRSQHRRYYSDRVPIMTLKLDRSLKSSASIRQLHSRRVTDLHRHRSPPSGLRLRPMPA